MNIKNLLRQLEGIQTINTVQTILKVNRKKAIYHIHRLRKQGYIKTKRLSNNTRVYNISFENKLGGKSYYEIINENSPIKIVTSRTYKIYGKEPCLEETLVYAIKTKSLRMILASLGLFKKIKDWNKLYSLSKKNHIEREVGALFDLIRKVIRTRKMTKNFRRRALPKKNYKFEYVISGLKSNDFKDIEKTWKIYLPFNRIDLGEYKR